MSYPEDQLAELKRLCPDAASGTEGGIVYFLLPGLGLPDGCSVAQADTLLCPTPRDGYSSRLFFDRVVASRQPLNWHMQNVRILDRNWNVYSWKVNRTGLRLAQMVLEHLRALR